MKIRMMPRKKYQFQFPLKIKIDRYGYRVCILTTLQPPITKLESVYMPTLSGWLDADLP